MESGEVQREVKKAHFSCLRLEGWWNHNEKPLPNKCRQKNNTPPGCEGIFSGVATENSWPDPEEPHYVPTV